MMDITNNMTLELLLIANASLVAACCIALTRFRRQALRFEKFWDSPTGASIADAQLHAQPSQVQTDPELAARVAELQSVVRTLALKSRPGQQNVENKLPIENAVRMARSGASLNDLIRSCGLNIGEAELLRKLHGNASVAALPARATA
jgi:Protein of unknown function (DUF2802)